MVRVLCVVCCCFYGCVAVVVWLLRGACVLVCTRLGVLVCSACLRTAVKRDRLRAPSNVSGGSVFVWWRAVTRWRASWCEWAFVSVLALGVRVGLRVHAFALLT